MDTIRNSVLSMFDSDNKFDTSRFRLSESGYHPEWRLLKALGMIPQDREACKGLFFAGLSYEYLVTRHLGRIFKQKIRYQEKVHHPDGTGHIDAVVTIDGVKWGIEIKTTSLDKIRNAPFAYNVMQVQAYMHFKPDIPKFALIYVPREDPHPDLWRWFPVEKNFETGYYIEKTLMGLMDRRMREDLTTEYPSFYNSYFIPNDDRCYISGDRKACDSIEAHAAELAEYVDMKSTMQYMSKYDAKQREPRQRELEEVITPLFSSTVAGESRSGSRFLDFNGARITQVVTERVTYAVKKAESCGVDVAMLEPFKKVSKSVSYKVSMKGENENGYCEE